MDATDLSRIQFAMTIMFHYLFPPVTIGLGVLLVACEALYLRTKDAGWEAAARFLTAIFAVNFAMGVATGIVMEFQFGTNWATYSRFVGDVFGSALAAEGIFAFFLESGFLAVLVFGWDRVSPRMHFLATVLVAFGSIFSAVWIVVANSWQQTPAGHRLEVIDGVARARIDDFWALVFNPSSLGRLSHVLSGSLLAGAFLALSIAAWYAIKGRYPDFSRRVFTVALPIALVAGLVQAATGDWQGRIVARTQPAKLAAMEGLYRTPEGGAPLHAFGIPDDDEQRVKFGLAIPGGLSFLVHHDFDTPVPGLDQVAPDERPPVQVPFQAFHAMVALGLFMLAVAAAGIWLHRKGTLARTRWFLWVLVFAVGAPYAANQLGWVAAEVGRQPWVVHGLLKTRDAISRSVPAGQIAASIGLFALIYGLLFAVWVFVMDGKIKHGPDAPDQVPPPGHEGFVEVAGLRTSPAGESMTDAHDHGPRD